MRLELSRAIEDTLAFSQGWGYVFAGVREQATDALGTYLEGSYTNTTANRIVRVVYLPGHNAPRAVAITRIELVVSEPLDEFDYTSLGSMEVCVTDLSAVDGNSAAQFVSHLHNAEHVLR